MPIGPRRLAAAYAGRRGRGAGVHLVTTAGGAARPLHRGGRAAYGARRLLVYDGWNRIGSTAYRLGGRRAFRLLRGRRIENVQVKGRLPTRSSAGARASSTSAMSRRQPVREAADGDRAPGAQRMIAASVPAHSAATTP